MAKDDNAMWTFVGLFIGLVTAYLVNPSSMFYLLGGFLGGIMGYMLSKELT